MTKPLGSRHTDVPAKTGSPAEAPEPLASVLDYLGDEIDQREFVPTSELVDTVDVDPATFAQQMRERAGLRADP